MDLNAVCLLLHGIVSGLAYLHEEQVKTLEGQDAKISIKPSIAHCQISPCSVFIRGDGTACLGNLGNSVVQMSQVLDVMVRS